MDTFKQYNLALANIEENLTGEIDFQKVARIAGCSEYHFRRLFSFLSGLTLGEYVRRRRLAQAALELGKNDVRVIDIALKYGYDSPDSFSRAFQAIHGVTPKEARKAGVSLKAFPPLTFHLTIKGGDEMDYRLVEKSAFIIVGLKKRISLQYDGVNPEIAEMWFSLTETDIGELKLLSTEEPSGLVSASINFSAGRQEGTELDQWIGVAATGPYTGKWQQLAVPAGLWAVFTARGKFPQTLQSLWGRIYSEWFAMAGYELREGPEILWNESKDTSLPDFHSEIWIPVIRK